MENWENGSMHAYHGKKENTDSVFLCHLHQENSAEMLEIVQLSGVSFFSFSFSINIKSNKRIGLYPKVVVS